MLLDNKRKHEYLIYSGIWALVITLCLFDVMRIRTKAGLSPFDLGIIVHMGLRLLPFAVLFAVNNFLLVPKLVFKGRYLQYLCMAALLVLLIWGWQGAHFLYEMTKHAGHAEPGHFAGPKPILPLPVFLDFVYDLLVVGVNLAIALVFQHIEDNLERERMMKNDAENQLAYLKAQINPHFYMNMLNNIHGMIDINPVKAQDMLIDMSHLMRYMLYESSHTWIALQKEIDFLQNYLNIMRLRYPDDKVKISLSLPAEKCALNVMVPPLLFLVFIENAFKHGVSYREESFVSISVELSGGNVEFNCINSLHGAPVVERDEGIGLKNIRQRLRLIYSDRCQIGIRLSETSYLVNLTIPAYENKDLNNR